MTNGTDSTILSSSVTKAYAWLRDQRDERDERLDEQGADRTAQCLRGADGVYRAPLNVLIERGESTEDDGDMESIEDFSDDDILEAFGFDDSDFEVSHPEPDDEYSRMAEQLLCDRDDTTDPVTAVAPDYSDIESQFDSKEPTKPSSTFSFLIRDHRSYWTDKGISNTAPRIVGKLIIRKDNRYLKLDLKSWKATTVAQCQFLRHKRVNQRRPAFASHTIH
jgi:hypothetical protein